MKFLKKNQNTIIWGVVIILGVVIVSKYGKKVLDSIFKFTKKSPQDSNAPAATLTTGEAKAICARVITDTFWFSSDSDVYKELAKFKPNDIKKISNVWISEYYDSQGQLDLAEFIQENKVSVSSEIQDAIDNIIANTN